MNWSGAWRASMGWRSKSEQTSWCPRDGNKVTFRFSWPLTGGFGCQRIQTHIYRSRYRRESSNGTMWPRGRLTDVFEHLSNNTTNKYVTSQCEEISNSYMNYDICLLLMTYVTLQPELWYLQGGKICTQPEKVWWIHWWNSLRYTVPFISSQLKTSARGYSCQL